MGVREYVRASLFEYVLLTVAVAALGYAVACGFAASDVLAADPAALPVAVAAPLVAALYAVGYSRRSLAVGVPLLVLALAGLAAAAVAAGGGANVFADEPGALAPVVAVLAAVAVAGFALSRTRAGCAVLAVAGCWACALNEYLYQEGHLASCALFVAAAAGLLVYRGYRRGLAGTQTRRTSFAGAAGVALGAGVLAAGLACAVFMLVVAPLAPGALDVKLVTEYRALEELPRRGVSEELAVTDPDLTSVVVGDRIDYADQGTDDTPLDVREDEELDEGQDPAPAATFASAFGYNLLSMQEALRAVTHETVWWGWVLVVLAVVAVLLAPFAAKLALRRLWYRRALACPPREFVARVYGRTVRDLERMGLARSAAATPYEYADVRHEQLGQFARNDAGANFALVTRVFVRARYGSDALGAAEVQAVDAFWRAFYKNCRAYLGTARYLRLFFRL